MRRIKMETLEKLPDELWMRLNERDQQRVMEAYSDREIKHEYVELSNGALLCRRGHPLEEHGYIEKEDVHCRECDKLKEQKQQPEVRVSQMQLVLV